MARTLVGMVTFGNVEFTKLAISSIKDTTEKPIDFFCVVGKPGDTATIEYLISKNIPFITHNINLGFPYSINDIYYYAWKHNDYDYLIIVGNDIIAYPNSIDSLIHVADTTDYEVISASQYDVKDLVRDYPETRKHFGGEYYKFYGFSSVSSPWKHFTKYDEPLSISSMMLSDIQNMCLYKKSVINTIGYTDVNFYPAYFVDNDYAMRIVKLGIRCCTVENARFFHFWSRTIHQGSGGSNHVYFRKNEAYYIIKWGGKVGHENKTPILGIFDRSTEQTQIARWVSTQPTLLTK